MTSRRPDRPLRLTVSQRRHLAVSFGKILDEMEELSHSLQRWPLPGDQQDRVLEALAELRETIAELARKLGFRPAALRPDPARKLQALASHWWETVLNCRSRVLRGYGELDPEIGPRLDPLLDEVAAALLNLSALGGEGGAETEGPTLEDTTS